MPKRQIWGWYILLPFRIQLPQDKSWLYPHSYVTMGNLMPLSFRVLICELEITKAPTSESCCKGKMSLHI